MTERSPSPAAAPALASGLGSWPGTDIRTALREVSGILADGHLPYLPELPARGPGADLIGRTAGLLVDLPVDLQPSGWRLVDRPGRDAARTAALWREDLDELAEAYDGYAGRLKLQVCGPWTLAAGLWLPRGERAVVDPGACRDLSESLRQGIEDHLRLVRRLVPGADLVLQLDEPSLPAILAGRLPTASGFGRLPAITRETAVANLRAVLPQEDAIVHCCAADPPIALLRETGARALSLDVTLLGPRGWESVAVAVESGQILYAGAVPTSGPVDSKVAADIVIGAWHTLGLDPQSLASVVVTPSCGLAGVPNPADAISRQRACLEVADRIGDVAAG